MFLTDKRLASQCQRPSIIYHIVESLPIVQLRQWLHLQQDATFMLARTHRKERSGGCNVGRPACIIPEGALAYNMSVMRCANGIALLLLNYMQLCIVVMCFLTCAWIFVQFGDLVHCVSSLNSLHGPFALTARALF